MNGVFERFENAAGNNNVNVCFKKYFYVFHLKSCRQ